MNNDGIPLRQSKYHRTSEKRKKNCLVGFFSLNNSKSSKDNLENKNQNRIKKTKQLNQPIVEMNSSENGQCKTGSDDMFVFEYEIAPFTLKKKKVNGVM